MLSSFVMASAIAKGCSELAGISLIGLGWERQQETNSFSRYLAVVSQPSGAMIRVIIAPIVCCRLGFMLVVTVVNFFVFGNNCLQ